MDNSTFIYALCDPRTSDRRYVGATFHPRSRLFHHLSQSNGSRGEWISHLKSQGLKPIMEILETVPKIEDAPARELFWMSKCIDEGCKLLNKRGDIRLAPHAGRRDAKRIAVFISENEHQKLRVLAAQQRTTVQEIAHALLVCWIAEQEQEDKDALVSPLAEAQAEMESSDA